MARGVTNRRGFLTGLAVASEKGPYPPGITAVSLSNCTGCGDCVYACPPRSLPSATVYLFSISSMASVLSAGIVLNDVPSGCSRLNPHAVSIIRLLVSAQN